jgi:hypothetical protein
MYIIYKTHTMEFSNESPDQKIKLGKVVNKVLPIAQKVLPVAATIIPSLAPVATVVGAINRR